jgi:hypothetical protein
LEEIFGEISKDVEEQKLNVLVRLGVRFFKSKFNFYLVCEFQCKENVFG